ncbi:MAG TPA: hypothetical protein VN706_15690 [Gemmatimonadaceae bacterium]|nr:hypothetical protein [Gemmatimonadaceae bacterium]
MIRTTILAIATLCAVGACASGTRATAGGDVASVTPDNRNYLPVGTTMTVRFDQAISTASHEGDSFSGTVVNAVYASDNTIAVPAGATLYGHVTGVHVASMPTEQNVIRLNFDRISLNGRTYPFTGAISDVTVSNPRSIASSTTRNAVTGAAAGAVLGAVLSGGELSKIITGGLLGAAAGTVISMGTSSGTTPATIPAGSTATVKATQPVQVR